MLTKVLIIPTYLSLKESVAIYFNQIKSPLPKDALYMYQV